MPTELVLLSDTAPSAAVISALGQDRHPGGLLLEYEGAGIRQFVDAHGCAVASFFTARPLHVTGDAQWAVHGGVEGFRLWTDVTVPYGDDAAGRLLARAVAEAVGGDIRERN